LVFNGAIWRAVADLVRIIPNEILDEVEIVAGPQSVGDTLAAGKANIISARGPKVRHVNCVPIDRDFESMAKGVGRKVYSVKKYYRDRLSGRKVLFVDQVTSTGKTATKCKGVLEDAGAIVLAEAYIADLRQIRSDIPCFALFTEPQSDVYPIGGCPMCRDGVEMTKF
jgi:orotate phosphoribosyltransferase